jgi:hypothetical protein
MFAFARKTLLQGRKLEPHDYRLARRALELIAIPIGRGEGRGRPMKWLLRVAKRVASRRIPKQKQ